MNTQMDEKDVREILHVLRCAYEDNVKEWAYETLSAYVHFEDWVHENYKNLFIEAG